MSDPQTTKPTKRRPRPTGAMSFGTGGVVEAHPAKVGMVSITIMGRNLDGASGSLTRVCLDVTADEAAELARLIGWAGRNLVP